jgi:hypothetical protein
MAIDFGMLHASRPQSVTRRSQSDQKGHFCSFHRACHRPVIHRTLNAFGKGVGVIDRTFVCHDLLWGAFAGTCITLALFTDLAIMRESDVDCGCSDGAGAKFNHLSDGRNPCRNCRVHGIALIFLINRHVGIVQAAAHKYRIEFD